MLKLGKLKLFNDQIYLLLEVSLKETKVINQKLRYSDYELLY